MLDRLELEERARDWALQPLPVPAWPQAVASVNAVGRAPERASLRPSYDDLLSISSRAQRGYRAALSERVGLCGGRHSRMGGGKPVDLWPCYGAGHSHARGNQCRSAQVGLQAEHTGLQAGRARWQAVYTGLQAGMVSAADLARLSAADVGDRIGGLGPQEAATQETWDTYGTAWDTYGCSLGHIRLQRGHRRLQSRCVRLLAAWVRATAAWVRVFAAWVRGAAGWRVWHHRRCCAARSTQPAVLEGRMISDGRTARAHRKPRFGP